MNTIFMSKDMNFVLFKTIKYEKEVVILYKKEDMICQLLVCNKYYNFSK